MEAERVLQLHEVYADDVFRLSFSFLGNRQDAMDAVQDVFLKCLESSVSLFPEKEKSWLLTVTANHCKNLLKKRRSNEPLDGLELPSADFQTELFELLSGLGPKDRAIIQLFYFDGYSQKEISQILGISASAVSMRLTRARTKLKGFLEEK